MSLKSLTTTILALTLPLLAMSCSTQSSARGDQTTAASSDNDANTGSEDDGNSDSNDDGNAGDDDSTPPAVEELHGQAPAQPLGVPTFEALNSDGATRSTPDLLGHPTVLWFFPYAGTPV